MSSSIYYIKGGSLSFGGKELFSEMEFFLNKTDRICLIGKNGCGKSSLMKIISNIYELDAGETYIDPYCRIGYLEQDMKLVSKGNVRDFVIADLKDEKKKFKSDIILHQLGLSGKEECKNLSGGQIRRTYLAKALLEEPEILLLDEPTNHLDIALIEWLEDYIKSYRGAVICISHDRTFLNNVTNKIWWLDRCHLRKSDKGFKYFEEWQEEILQIEESSLHKLTKKMKVEEIWLNQGISARRKRNQGRLSQLKSLRGELRHKQNLMASSKQKMSPEQTEQLKKMKFIMQMDKVSFSYDHQIMLDEFSFRVQKGEKIGIIGPNGSGKSTFIKLLIKELTPSAGKIRHGALIDITYFDQYRSILNPELTIQKTLAPNGGDHVHFANDKYMHVCSYMKKFMFDPQELNSKVSILSGGEKNRLLLAKMLIKPGNVLILDEPTNDLDMDSLEILLEILSDYKGTIICVSHDRDFLERLVSRSLVFEGNGKIIDLVGGYEDYLKFYKKPELNAPLPKPKKEEKALKPKQSPTKLSYKYQRLLELIPKQIEELKKENLQIEEELSVTDLYQSEPEKFSKLSSKLSENNTTISNLTEEWLELESKNG